MTNRFAAGDLVTRDGTDVHRVLWVNDTQDGMEVVCVKAPASGWTTVGEREFNLTRRYEFSGEIIDHEKD